MGRTGRPRRPQGVLGDIATKQLDNGRWQARAEYRDAAGKRRTLRATGATKTAARNALTARAQKRLPLASVGDITPSTSVEQMVTAFSASLQGDSGLKPGTVQLYEAEADRIIAAWGGRQIGSLTPGGVDLWLRGLGPSTRKRARTVFAQALDEAVRADALPANPVRNVPPAPRNHHPREVPRALAPEDLVAVRESVTAWEKSVTTGHQTRWLPLRDVLLMQLATGTRIAEVLAVRWTDVDLDEALCDISGSLSPVRGQGLVRLAPKTEHSDRWVELPTVAVDMLRRRLAALPEGIDHQAAPVFPSRAGTFMWPHNLRRAWREAREMSERDLSWVKPHSLRKTAGTLVAGEAGVRAAQLFLGHSDSRVTEEHYLDPRIQRPKTADILDALMTGW